MNSLEELIQELPPDLEQRAAEVKALLFAIHLPTRRRHT